MWLVFEPRTCGSTAQASLAHY